MPVLSQIYHALINIGCTNNFELLAMWGLDFILCRIFKVIIIRISLPTLYALCVLHKIIITIQMAEELWLISQ